MYYSTTLKGTLETNHMITHIPPYDITNHTFNLVYILWPKIIDPVLFCFLNHGESITSAQNKRTLLSLASHGKWAGYCTLESPQNTVRRKNWFSLVLVTSDLTDSEQLVFTEIRNCTHV